MIDIETLGARYGDVMLCAYTCKFDLQKRDIDVVKSFYFDINASLEKGFKIEGDTLMWWLKEDPALLKDIIEYGTSSTNHYNIEMEIERLFYEIDNCETIWCKGASFDFPILKAYFDRFDMQTPWNFKQERCLRHAFDFIEQDYVGKKHTKDDVVNQITNLFKSTFIMMNQKEWLERAIQFDLGNSYE